MDELPYELIVCIFTWLDRHSIYILYNTSRRLRDIIYQRYIEPEFNLFTCIVERYINLFDSLDNLEKIIQCQYELLTYPCNLIIYHKDFESTSLSVNEYLPTDEYDVCFDYYEWNVGRCNRDRLIYWDNDTFGFWHYDIQAITRFISVYYKYTIQASDKYKLQQVNVINLNKNNWRMFLRHPTTPWVRTQPNFISQFQSLSMNKMIIV